MADSEFTTVSFYNANIGIGALYGVAQRMTYINTPHWQLGKLGDVPNVGERPDGWDPAAVSCDG